MFTLTLENECNIQKVIKILEDTSNLKLKGISIIFKKKII